MSDLLSYPDHKAAFSELSRDFYAMTAAFMSFDDGALLGAMLIMRAHLQAAICTLTEKIQAEHPGALT